MTELGGVVSDVIVVLLRDGVRFEANPDVRNWRWRTGKVPLLELLRQDTVVAEFPASHVMGVCWQLARPA